MFWLPCVLSRRELLGLLCLREGGRFGGRSLVESPFVVFAIVGAAVGHQRSGVGILVRKRELPLMAWCGVQLLHVEGPL